MWSRLSRMHALGSGFDIHVHTLLIRPLTGNNGGISIYGLKTHMHHASLRRPERLHKDFVIPRQVVNCAVIRQLWSVLVNLPSLFGSGGKGFDLSSWLPSEKSGRSHMATSKMR